MLLGTAGFYRCLVRLELQNTASQNKIGLPQTQEHNVRYAQVDLKRYFLSPNGENRYVH